MIQTALGINGYDCTFCDGNTAEEYEAIAVSAAPDSRGDPQSRRRQGGMPRTGCKVLASVLIHHCGPECDEDALA